MKGIFGRGLIKKAVAILTSLVLCFSGASNIGAVDYIHNEGNHHYLIYSDVNALFEKMVIAYNSDNRAFLGGNVYLPITENSQVTEGSEYLSDIQANLADKYLVDTVVITDQLIVYLTANVETYEFYLLVYNETEEEHVFTVLFANGVEFNDIATAYSFTLTEEVLDEITQEGEAGEIPAESDGNENASESGGEDGTAEEGGTDEVVVGDENSDAGTDEGNDGSELESGEEASSDDETNGADSDADIETDESAEAGSEEESSESGSSESGSEEGSETSTEVESDIEESGEENSQSNAGEASGSEGSSNNGSNDASVNEEVSQESPSTSEDSGENHDSEADNNETGANDHSDENGNDNSNSLEGRTFSRASAQIDANPSDDNAGEGNQENPDAANESDDATEESSDDNQSDPESSQGLEDNNQPEQSHEVDENQGSDSDGNQDQGGNQEQDGNQEQGQDGNQENGQEDSQDQDGNQDQGGNQEQGQEGNQENGQEDNQEQDGNQDQGEDGNQENGQEENQDQGGNQEQGQEGNQENGQEDNQDQGGNQDQDGSQDQDQEEGTDPATLLGPTLEIGLFMSSLSVGQNSMTLRSQPNTATATEFVYDSGELGPTISKTIANNQDGTYTVTLTVKGNNDVVTTKKPINLVLALDVSNSMYWAMNNTALGVNLDVPTEPPHIRHTSASPESRWRVLKRAVNQIVDEVLTVEGSKISIVMFSGDNAATNSSRWDTRNFSILQEWSSNASSIKSTYTDKELWELTYGPNGNFENRVGAGGTNGEAGFLASGIQLGKIDANSKNNPNYVVYISDGIANRYLSDSGNVTTIRSDTASEFQNAANEAIAVAKSVKSQYDAKIYTVGISNALTTNLGVQYCGYLLNPTGRDKYQEAYYTAATSASLSQALTSISQSISGNKLTDLVVTDQLSEYVNFAGSMDDDGNGATIDANGKITWNVAGALSSLETRTLSYKVTVNNVAAYRDENQLVPASNYSNDRNDLIGYYTQNSSDKKLYFHSNEYAILHYNNINSEPKYAHFTHPSVEPGIRPNTLEIEKRIVEGHDVPDGVEFEFFVKVNNTPVNTTVVSSTNQTRNIVNGQLFLNAGEKVTIYVEGRSDGTLVPYEVTEVEYIEEGFKSELVYVEFITGEGSKTDNKVSGVMGTKERRQGRDIYKPGNVSLIFENSYEPIVGTITVNKSINDYYSAHGNPVFFYRLDRLEGDVIAETYYEYVEFDISSINHKVFNGESINSKNSTMATSPIFDELPAGTYILTEQQPIRYEYGSVALNEGIADLSAASKANNGRAVIVINNANTEVELTYVNEKTVHTNFSHTDVVKNLVNIVIPD